MKLLVLLLLIVSLAAPLWADEKKKEETQTQEAIVNYEVLQQTTYSGYKEPLAKVITDSKDWTDLWKKHVSLLVPQPPVPEVDFKTYVVAVIFSGEKPTSGYQISMKDVVQQGDDVVVRYRMVEPPPNSLTMQVFTQPHVMLKIARPKGTVRLEQIKP